MLVQGEDHSLGFPVKNANQDTSDTDSIRTDKSQVIVFKSPIIDTSVTHDQTPKATGTGTNANDFGGPVADR